MRWVTKVKKYHNDGDIRIISRFLIIPMGISNHYRWLERVSIEQRYVGIKCDGHDVSGGYWINAEWVDI